MELRQLEYILDAASTKSFSKTAKNLFTTQQNVSKTVQALETELGFQLFERTRTGVEPLGHCGEFFESARIVCNHVSRLHDVAERINQSVSHAIRMCMPFCSIGSTGGLISHKVIEAFRKRCPDCTFTYEEKTSSDCVEGVASDVYTFGVSVGPPHDERLRCIFLTSRFCKVLVSRANPLSRRENVSFADLEFERIIPPPDRSYSLNAIIDHCRSCGFDPLLTEPFDQLNTIIELVYANSGVTFIMESHEQLIDVRRATLVPLSSDDALVIPLYTIWKPNTKGERFAQLFLECALPS